MRIAAECNPSCLSKLKKVNGLNVCRSELEGKTKLSCCIFPTAANSVVSFCTELLI